MNLVSIIVPNYNHGRFLKERLESILHQTFGDYEIIILDDCSTDDSREIIEQYRCNPKVSAVVYNDANSGSPFVQWEKGLALAKGEYVWIAESDDTCEPCFLETLMTAIRSSHNCVMAYCGTCEIGANGEMIAAPESVGKDVFYTGKSFVVKKLLLCNAVYNASCAVFKRTIALQISREWMNSRGAGDYWFWVLMAERGNVYSVRRPIAYRRIHGTNVTGGADSSGSNLRAERLIVNHICGVYRVGVWRKILAENLRRRRIRSEKFDNEEIRADLCSDWAYGSKLGLLPELITKAFFTLRKLFSI